MYIVDKKLKRSKNILKVMLVIASCVLVFVLSLVILTIVNKKTSQPKNTTTSVSQKKIGTAQAETVKKDKISSNVLFVGDTFWGRAIETRAVKSGIGPANIFRGLTSADRVDFDAWVGDLECPVTDKNIPYQTQVDALLFNCRPEYVAEAAKWFDAFSLSNNYTANNGGVWGIEQTRANLEKSGIQYFGNYDMSKTDDICEVVTLPAKSEVDDKVSLPVALCGFDYVGDVAVEQSQLDVMAKFAKVMPVLAMPHMGVEYRATGEEAKVSTYRKLIDSGADAVMGGHPHVVQNSETYKGKLIAYSMGNFLFDQQILGHDTVQSFAVGLKMTINDQKAVEIYKKTAPSCKTYKDQCLEDLTKSLSKRPEISVSYDFRCFEESTGTPIKATDAECAAIKKIATTDQLNNLAKTW